MSNIREFKQVDKQTVVEGLRAIIAGLENGTLEEPPFALLVFGIDANSPGLNVIPVGAHMPNELETVGMLSMAAQAVSFGEAEIVASLPTD